MRKFLTVSRRRYRLLMWCLVISLAFHFLIVPVLVTLFGLHRPSQVLIEQVYQARSSSLKIARRNVPHPQSPPHPRTIPRPHPQRQPQPVQHVAQAVQPAPQPRVVARVQPHAEIHVPHLASTSSPSSSINIAQQQAVFEKTIARLRREDDPLVSAARPVATPAAARRYTYNFSGGFGSSHAEGVLTPVRAWHDGPYDYYYVAYSVQYADGSTETGYVPWPLRYLPRADPFLQHWEHFPLPVPLPDFELPPGTNLHPLIAFCLEHRTVLNDCPIEHD